MIHFKDMTGMERMAFRENVGLGWQDNKDAIIKKNFYVYADGHCHQVIEEQYNSVIDQMGFNVDDDMVGALPIEAYDDKTIEGMLVMMAGALSMHTDKPQEMILRDIAANASALANKKSDQPNLL